MSAQLSNPYYLRQFKNPDSDLQGGITAAMPAGSFGGALINSWLSDRIGRKKCIMLSGWIWVIGCAIQAAAPNVPALVAGRVIAGLGVRLSPLPCGVVNGRACAHTLCPLRCARSASRRPSSPFIRPKSPSRLCAAASCRFSSSASVRSRLASLRLPAAFLLRMFCMT